jgi:hypothetical protein
MRKSWLFYGFLFFILVSDSRAQRSEPPEAESVIQVNVGQKSTVLITGTSLYRSERGAGTFYPWDRLWTAPGTHKIVAVKHRVRPDLPQGLDELFILLENGSVYEVLIYTALGEDKIYKPVRWGGLNDSTESQIVKEMTGDDLYMLSFEAVYVSRDNGVNWSVDTVGLSGATVNDITTAYMENVYAATTKGILFQSAKGNTWEGLSAPASASSIFYDSVDRQLYAGMTDGSILTGPGDHNWNTIPALVPNVTVKKWGVDVYGDLFAALSNGAVFRKMNAAFNDITQNLRAAIGHSTYQINMIGGDSIVYAATTVGLYRSTDHGDTWTSWNDGIRAEHIYSMQKLPSGEFFTSAAAGIFRANPLGTAWSKALPRRLPLLRYGNTLYAYESGTPSVLWSSTNAGVNWLADTAPAFVDLGNVSVDEFGTLHAISGTYSSTLRAMIYERKPGGLWTADTDGYSPSTQGSGYAVVSDLQGHLYAATNFKGGPNVLRRPIGGGTWTPFATGLGTPPYLTNFVAGPTMLSNFGPTIYQAGPAGWAQMTNPTGISGSVTSMSVDSNGTIFAAFSNNGHGQGIYYLPVGSTSWTNAGYDSLTVNTMMSDGSTTYAATNHGIYALTAKAASAGLVTPLSQTIDFGDVAIGDSAGQTVTIANSGTETSIVSSMTINGGNSFSIGGGIDLILPLDSLKLLAQFKPTTAGPQSATLSLATSNGNATVLLKGNGVEAGVSAGTTNGSELTNYPNPFTSSTQFRFALSTREHVALTVRDILGHEVARLADGMMDLGNQQLEWNAAALPDGVYVVELVAGEKTLRQRIVK